MPYNPCLLILHLPQTKVQKIHLSNQAVMAELNEVKLTRGEALQDAQIRIIGEGLLLPHVTQGTKRFKK